jgi:hypothetical protein
MTMASERKHRCGGSLAQRDDLVVSDHHDRFLLSYVVPGLVCRGCGEEFLERDTVARLQRYQTPSISWQPKGATSTNLGPSMIRSAAMVAPVVVLR